MTERVRVRVTAWSSLACFALQVAQGVQPGARAPLPDWDVRNQSPAQFRPPGQDAQNAVASLTARVPDAKVDWDEKLGTPQWITARHGFLSGPDGQGRGVSEKAARRLPASDPDRPAKAFLNEHAALFGHDASALDSARVDRRFTSPHNQMRTVVWQQYLHGLPVLGGLLIAHTTQQGELASLSGGFIPDASGAANRGHARLGGRPVAPTVGVRQAIASAAGNVGDELTADQVIPAANPAGATHGYQNFGVSALLGATYARLVWLPLDRLSLRQGWEVIFTSRKRSEMFRVIVDAETGEVLVRHCLTRYLSDATYRVFTSDSPSPFSPGHATPQTNQPPLVSRALITLSALSATASPNGWINDGVNETRGNNVDAHLDHNGDNVPDLPRPQGSPWRVFDFPLDLDQAPITYGDAAVVQLFYWCNWMHDQLYGLGFNEAAGNFQTDNFSRGGLGSDAVLAEAQDGADVNNSRFSTPPDGLPGRMEMYLWDAPTPDRDGDLDAEVILHEYAHGLTDRRVGGGAGITELQSKGLAEGWSDFFALALLSQPGDNLSGNYAIGAYVALKPPLFLTNYYFGGRRYPYSTDQSKNPLTFKDIDPTQATNYPGIPRNTAINGSASEIHNQGEVWCVALWEARAILIRKCGFTNGNRLVLQLVTDGLNLAPPNPNFVQARDAILLADRINNGGANFFELWTGFAKRGLGYSATAPVSSTTTGVRESFDVPDTLCISPRTGFTSSGSVGGPFSPFSLSHVLTNLGTNLLTWTVINTNAWLTPAPTSGNLVVGGPAAAVTVSLNETAAHLPMGIFSGTVLFSNQVSGVAQALTYTLRIDQPDHFTELFDANDNDLDFQTFTFVPDGSASFYSVCREAATNFPTAPAGGSAVSLTDDSFAAITVTDGKQVSLYGTNSTILFVGSNGYLTFGSGDSERRESLTNHFNRLRISALFEDLNPSGGGSVTWKQLSNRVAVTFLNVPEYNTTTSNSFQIELFFDGTIRLTYLSIAARGGLVGLSRGTGLPPGFIESDFSSYGGCSEPLELTLPLYATEGDGLLVGQGQVRIPLPLTNSLWVQLASGDPSEVTTPAGVMLPAGQTSSAFDLTVVDDSLLDGTRTAAVTASAPGYRRATNSMTIFDNESATLTVDLPASVIEGIGSVLGTVEISAPPADDVPVRLTTSYSAEIQVPEFVIIPAEKTFAMFTVTVLDDPRIDGPQTASVVAHVENWIDGAALITVQDNDLAILRVSVPSAASEDDGFLPGAGAVRLMGTLPTNLVVWLASDRPDSLAVAPTVVVPAGTDHVPFDVTILDNSVANGAPLVAVTATANGFTSGSAMITIRDDETPGAPLNPSPPHLATNVPLEANLSWSIPVRELIVNGGFETGDFTGWIQENQGPGGFYVNNGAYDPTSVDGPLPPLTGSFSAISDQSGPSQHTLYQDITIPGGSSTVTLLWSHRLRNHAGVYATNQQFRVEIRDATNNVLAVAYATDSSEPLYTSWIQRSYDLTAFKGRNIRLAFVEEDQLGYFNIHLDDVSVTVGSAVVTTYDVYLGTTANLGPSQFLGSTTDPDWALPSLLPLTTYYWKVVARRVGQSASPVWRFTTRGVHHFEWNPIPSPQQQCVPFTATLIARDELNRVVTNFLGPVSLSARVELPDLAIDEGSELSRYPLATGSHDARTQVIYLASELGGPRGLAALALQVAAQSGQTLRNWTIRMKHTALDRYITPQWEWDEWTTVYQHDETIVQETWVYFPFDAPFYYNGANNLMIDFSFNNSSMSDDGSCWTTATTDARTLSFSTDSHYGDPLNWSGTTPTPQVLNQVPNLRLTPEKPAVVITPVATDYFEQGIWTGQIAVREAGSRIVLKADDGSGHAGLSAQFTVLLNPDCDGDGMPNDWETAYGLNPYDADDARQDADGDGAVNIEEYRAGTNPLDPTSVFRIVEFRWVGSDVEIGFTSVAGTTYRVERCVSLSGTGPWVPVGGHLAGTGDIIWITDPEAAGNDSRYYRVKVVPIP